MSLVVAQIDIAAPPEVVWDTAMDPARTTDWVTIARGVDRVDEGPLRPGFRMDQALCLRGMNFHVKWRLDEVDAPWFARWKGKGPARSKALIENRLHERDGGGTHFEYRNEFKAPFGPLGSVASGALVGGVPEREARASLQRLKQLLEK